MIERYQRCQHCGDEYIFQASGDGCQRATNDEHLCPSCKQVVIDALAKVPRKYECRYQNVKEIPKYADVTLAQVLEWEERQLAPRKEGKLVGQRIWPGLINLNTGDAQDIREVRNPEGIKFRISTWRQKDEALIEMPMEWDIREGRFTGFRWRG